MKIIHRIAFLTILATVPSISAAPDFEQYKNRGAEKLQIIQDLQKKYPFAPEFNQQIESTMMSWEDTLLKFRHATRSERGEAFKAVQEQYRGILEISYHLAIVMRGYSQELLTDFAARKKEYEKEQTLDRDKYVHSINVARQEISRAEKAMRREQWAHAAGVFDHSVQIVLKTYKKLNFATPAFLNRQPTEKNSQRS